MVRPKADPNPATDLNTLQREAKRSLLQNDVPPQMDARPLSRVQLALARLCLFDFFKNKTYLLTKRPLKAISLISPRQQLGCALDIATTAAHVERGAVEVSAQFYKWYGREIPSDEQHQQKHELFADPMASIIKQPCYFSPPRGAFWAKLCVERCTAERRISMKGSLRMRAYNEALLPFDTVIKSRDQMQLRAHLQDAFERCDRKAALIILEQLIFLTRTPDDIQTMKVVRDAEDVMTRLGDMDTTAPVQEGDADTFQYTKTFTPQWDGRYPLSKWLKSEIVFLQSKAGNAALQVTDGPDAALRALAVVSAGVNNAKLPELESLSGIAWIASSDIRKLLLSKQD